MADTAAQNLGQRLLSQFQTVLAQRVGLEDGWLRDLRQYKGIYDPEVLARIHPKKSRAYIRETRKKVKTSVSMMMESLFPASGDLNWIIEPTPIPQIDPDVRAHIVTSLTMQAGGQVPDQATVDKAVEEYAKKAAEAMSDEISDQLSETSYRDIIRKVILSGNLYGTGILKGPLVEKRSKRTWGVEGGSWIMSEVQHLRPYLEFVPIWSIYPDLSATSPDRARFIYQRHLLARHEVRDLGKIDGFDKAGIRAYLSDNPTGNAKVQTWEEQIRLMAQDRNAQDKNASGGSERPSQTEMRYEVLEYWGYVDGADLAGVGVEIPEGGEPLEFVANVWLLGNVVIKAVLSPIDGVRWPYFWYFWDKDETSIFGEGLASIMRDPQQLENASVRAMLDNMAISAGPQVEANMDLISDGEDVTDLPPFKIWPRRGRGTEAANPALRVYEIPCRVNEFRSLAADFREYGDETSGIPRYQHGEDTKTGAAATATGLSILMNASAADVKDQIKFFDEGITQPFIEAMYFWNMQFSDRKDIKGDFNIQARGYSALVAREVRANQLNGFFQMAASTPGAQYIKWQDAMRRAAKGAEVGEDLVMTQDEIDAQQAQAAKMQAQSNVEAMLGQAQKHGMDPKAVIQNAIAQYLAPQIAAATSPSGQMAAPGQTAQGAQ